MVRYNASISGNRYQPVQPTMVNGVGPGKTQIIPWTAPAGYAPDTGNNAELDDFGGINIQT
jgi:hypothetical protein